MDVSGITIAEVDLRKQTDEELCEFYDFLDVFRQESRPDDPRVPDEVAIAHVRNVPNFMEMRTYVARDESGSIVGTARASWDSSAKDNRHLLESGVQVLPSHRRRGIGTALLERLLDVAEAQSRTLLAGGTNDRIEDGRAFASRVGAQAAQVMRISRVFLADIDRSMVEQWVADGPKRAPDYELVFCDGPLPEELIEPAIEAFEYMNTAPKDDLEVEDWKITPEQVREWQKELVATGSRQWALFAKHRDTGRFVGFTEVGWHPKVPGIIHQHGTAVAPEHRGHALGKWLKADMVLRLFDEPDAKEIRTGNAESNDAMLGINVALGFKPFFASTAWQVRTETVRDYLTSRS